MAAHGRFQGARLLAPGDFVDFPHDFPHCIAGGTEPPPPERLNRSPPTDDAEPLTSPLYGFFRFRNKGAWPLLDSLPECIILHVKSGGTASGAARLIRLLVAELEQPMPGVDVVKAVA